MAQVVTVSEAQRLYLELQALAERFESDLQGTHERFLEAAIPICRNVKNVKPWLTPEFANLQNPDEFKSLRAFLRASFCHGSEHKTAFCQASVLAMIVTDDFDFEIVRGIQFGRLLKLSYTLEWIGREDRLRLLERARTAVNYQEFDAYVESLKAGHHIEPKTPKFMVGSKSAADALDRFNKITKQRGDNRPEMEKLADLANVAITVDPEANTKSARILNGFCRFMRTRDRGLALDSDMDILAAVIFAAWRSWEDEFDPATAEEYAEIQAMR